MEERKKWKKESKGEKWRNNRERNLGPNCMKILEIFCLGEERDGTIFFLFSLSLCSIWWSGTNVGSKTHTSAFVGTNLHKGFSFSYCYVRNRHHHHEGIILFILFIIALSSSAFPGIHSVKVGSFLKLWKGKSRVREREKLESERSWRETKGFEKSNNEMTTLSSSLRCVFSRSEDAKWKNLTICSS